MERTPCCCTLASLVALAIFLFFPMRSWCEGATFKSLTQANTECCVNADTELKRSDDIAYDSFVSLMGRRSAAQPNSHTNAPVSRKRHINRILTDMLWRGTRKARLCTSG